MPSTRCPFSNITNLFQYMNSFSTFIALSFISTNYDWTWEAQVHQGVCMVPEGRSIVLGRGRQKGSTQAQASIIQKASCQYIELIFINFLAAISHSTGLQFKGSRFTSNLNGSKRCHSFFSRLGKNRAEVGGESLAMYSPHPILPLCVHAHGLLGVLFLVKDHSQWMKMAAVNAQVYLCLAW